MKTGLVGAKVGVGGASKLGLDKKCIVSKVLGGGTLGEGFELKGRTESKIGFWSKRVCSIINSET